MPLAMFDRQIKNVYFRHLNSASSYSVLANGNCISTFTWNETIMMSGYQLCISWISGMNAISR